MAQQQWPAAPPVWNRPGRRRRSRWLTVGLPVGVVLVVLVVLGVVVARSGRIGALIVGVFRNGLQLAGVEVVWQGFAIGLLVYAPWLILLLAVALVLTGDLEGLGGTTALLLLCVFTVVNIAVLVLRRDRVDHRHFKAPTVIPVLGAVVLDDHPGLLVEEVRNADQPSSSVEHLAVDVVEAVAGLVVAGVVGLARRAAVDPLFPRALHALGAAEQAAGRDADRDERAVVGPAVELRRVRLEVL